MRCPYCGSLEVMWDYERGDVICTACGTVIEKIYVTNPSPRMNEDLETLKTDIRSFDPMPKLSRTTREYLKLLNELKHSKRLSGKARIDTARFMNYVKLGGNRVKVIKVDLVNTQLTYDSRVKKVLRIMKKYPRLFSRTDRAKIALALIAISLLTKEYLQIAKISRSTGLSRMHVRRLLKMVFKEEKFLSEVSKELIME